MIEDLSQNNPEKLFSNIKNKLADRTWSTYKFENVEGRPAAVLIPMFIKDNEPHILFTLRTEKVEKHKGQISFPGGVSERDDKDLMTTALRETEEEMGILSNDVKILGRTDNFLTNTRYMVTPYVGYFNFPYQYKINKDEIERVIEVPLNTLLKPEVFRREKWKRDGIEWDMHFYSYNGDVIWGVTGFLLSNFLSIIFGIKRFQIS